MVARGIDCLTEQQKTAVEWEENIVLTACPGSGKTRTLIAKLVAAVDEVRGSARSVCCITYTNTGVHEVQLRAVEHLFSDDEHHVLVSTIHSFCLNEILRPYGWLLPEYKCSPTVLTPDSEKFREICDYAAFKAGRSDLKKADYDAFASLTVNVGGELISAGGATWAAHNAASHFWARCTELNYIDFGMIVFKSYTLLRDHEYIAETLSAKYAWFLIDEFQDTTDLQIEIFKLLYAVRRSRFFIVGDLSQSIYGFTGASPELVAPFARYINARDDLSLTGNFRCSPQITAHAERLIPRSPPMTAEGPRHGISMEPILIRNLPNMRAITEKFLPMLNSLGIPIGNATILAKDWKTLFSLARQLREFGVPIVGPGARPYKRLRLFALLAEQLCGVVQDSTPEASRQLERSLFHAIQELTGERRFDTHSPKGRLVLVRLMREARRLFGSATAIEFLDEMALSTSDILVKAEYVDKTQAGLLYASVQEMKADMVEQGWPPHSLSVMDLGLFASPDKALRLSTIHNAKGREYDAVALIGLTKGSFPHYNTSNEDEERRLLYVGITRARRALMYVSEPNTRYNPPSPFLGVNGLNVI